MMMRCWIFDWFLLLLLFLVVVGTAVDAHAPHDVVSSIVANGQTVFSLINNNDKQQQPNLLLRSDDGGLNWIRIGMSAIMSSSSSSSGDAKVSQMILSPNYSKDQTIFLLLANNNNGYLVSHDGGRNFEKRSTTDFDPCRMMLSPNFGKDDQRIFLVGNPAGGDNYRVYRSMDDGNSFQSVLDLGEGEDMSCDADDLVVMHAASFMMYFLATSGGELYGSYNGGEQWERVTGMLLSNNEPILGIVGSTTQKHSTELKQDLYILTAHTLEYARIGLTSNGFQLEDQSMMEPHLAPHRTFQKVLWHSGKTTSTTLMILQSGCSGCDQPFFTSQNGGKDWDSYAPSVQTQYHIQKNHNGPLLEYLDAFGVPGTNTIFLGSYQGVWKSNNNGNTWQHLDTISGWITGLSVGPTHNDGMYVLDFCTYVKGCYGGQIQINSDQEQIVNPQELVQLPELYETEIHPSLAVSPYEKGFALKSTSRMSNQERLWVTHHNFYDDLEHFIEVPALDPNIKTIVHQIVFAPISNSTQKIYVCGSNIGLALSTDNIGTSFESLWEPPTAGPDAIGTNGTVTKIAVSPQFVTDQTIAVLVDITDDDNDNMVSSHVFISFDQGKTFRRMTSEAQPWTNILFFIDNDVLLLMSVEQDGPLHHVIAASTFRTEWLEVKKTYFQTLGGFCRNGVVVSPNGDQIVAALEQGGTIRFKGYNRTTQRFAVVTTVEGGTTVDSYEPDFKFAFDGDGTTKGMGGESIVYSSYYDQDHTIFAASFYSIYASFDQGVHWKEIYRLPHNNTLEDESTNNNDPNETTLPPDDQKQPSILLWLLLGCFVVILGLVLLRKTRKRKKRRRREEIELRYPRLSGRIMARGVVCAENNERYRDNENLHESCKTKPKSRRKKKASKHLKTRKDRMNWLQERQEQITAELNKSAPSIHFQDEPDRGVSIPSGGMEEWTESYLNKSAPTVVYAMENSIASGSERLEMIPDDEPDVDISNRSFT